MRILLTNDDGIMAEGIYTLAKELEKDHEVIIVAPEVQRSAQSHGITLFEPLTIKEVELDGLKSKAYSTSGTPADCVRVAMEVLVKEPIDLVFSGINYGLNSGMDILYSGTVSAAIEANIYKVPAIAVSAELMDKDINFEIAAKYAKDILERFDEDLINSKIVLNINTPYGHEGDIKGVKVCKIGGPIYDYYIMEYNEEGDRVLKVKGRKDTEIDEETDRDYLRQGYVTVTPLHYDLTNYNLIERVKDWI